MTMPTLENAKSKIPGRTLQVLRALLKLSYLGKIEVVSYRRRRHPLRLVPRCMWKARGNHWNAQVSNEFKLNAGGGEGIRINAKPKGPNRELLSGRRPPNIPTQLNLRPRVNHLAIWPLGELQSRQFDSRFPPRLFPNAISKAALRECNLSTLYNVQLLRWPSWAAPPIFTLSRVSNYISGFRKRHSIERPFEAEISSLKMRTRDTPHGRARPKGNSKRPRNKRISIKLTCVCQEGPGALAMQPTRLSSRR